MEKRSRIDFINILQVIGPIFVILGHSLNGIDVKGPWFVFSKEWIYIFHMPFFFVISGFLLSKNGWLKGESYGCFIWKKCIKLIIPYFVWNILFLVPKYMAQSLITDEVTIGIKSTLKMFFYPRQNIWGHTWFLVGLFVFYCLIPLWKYALKNRFIFCMSIIVGIILYIVPMGSEFLCISDLHKDALFFLIGCYMGTVELERLKRILRKGTLIFGILAGLTSAIALFVIDNKGFDWIPCLCIILFIWAISVRIEKKVKFVETLAKRSFGIYILHWPSMLMVRILLLNILHVDITVTIIFMIILGYIIPNVIIALLQHINLKPIKTIRRVLLGC